MKKEIHKATACVHAGTYHDPMVPGINTPVFTSSAFDYRGEGPTAYPRYFNTPNQNAVVEKLKVLERGESAMVFSSGMAAISTTLMSFLKPGDHIIMQKGIYGGTHYLIESQLKKWKIQCSYILNTNLESLESALQENTKAIYVETPSNPLLEIVDLEFVGGFAKKNELVSLIDNTFATPINQNPICYGFDFVIHSGTKYLSGHSDVTFGAVITTQHYYEGLHTCAINFGGSLDANTCYLIERSLKTLSLRVSRQNETALSIALALDAHPLIRQVNYPGLPNHPNHETAKKQMAGFGGMLSFELGANDQELVAFLDNLQLISSAVSLGGVESTICSPSQTSHVKMSPEDRKAAGISNGLLRLSVGIEESKDLIEDLENALSKLTVVIS